MSRIWLPLIFLFSGLQYAAYAEVLNMPPPATEAAKQQSTTATMPAPVQSDMPAKSSRFSVTLPGRGMTMTQVEEKFGPPLEKSPEVGDPPINRWDYSNFTVYFEYQYVINAVAKVDQ